MLDATGSVAAQVREEPVSPYGYTDDELALRGRAWRFLTPAHERAIFDRAVAELAAKRVLPPELALQDPASYHRALMSDGSVSPSSRYRRVGEDAAADARLLPAFAEAARRVAVADGVRLKALGHARTLAPADVENARARAAENVCLLGLVRTALGNRIDGYRFALEHLVVETPQADAVPVERSIATLSRTMAALGDIDTISGCMGAPALPASGIAVPPLVLKG